MARNREFILEDVLESAMSIFWKKGYAATSITDLMDATGLAKGSIYKAFGDKHQLYLQALDFYLANTKREYKASLSHGPTALAAIKHWVVEGAHLLDTNTAQQNGCMAINSGIEMSEQFTDISKKLEAHRFFVFKLLVEKVKQGQAAKEIRTDMSPEKIASIICTFQMGINAGMGYVFNKQMVASLADAMLETIMKV